MHLKAWRGLQEQTDSAETRHGAEPVPQHQQGHETQQLRFRFSRSVADNGFGTFVKILARQAAKRGARCSCAGTLGS